MDGYLDTDNSTTQPALRGPLPGLRVIFTAGEAIEDRPEPPRVTVPQKPPAKAKQRPCTQRAGGHRCMYRDGHAGPCSFR